MNIYNEHPNFSILLPGSCNADCGFCYNKSIDGYGDPPLEYGEYLVKLIDVLREASAHTPHPGKVGRLV